MLGLLIGRDGIDVGGVGRERQPRTGAPRGRNDLGQDIVRRARSLEGDHRIDRVLPLLALGYIVELGHVILVSANDPGEPGPPRGGDR